jgi:hypothetical protein
MAEIGCGNVTESQKRTAVRLQSANPVFSMTDLRENELQFGSYAVFITGIRCATGGNSGKSVYGVV